MRRIDQTVTACPVRNDGHAADGTPGDCLRACLAMLLDVDLTAVPHVVMFAAWWDEARRTVRRLQPGADLAYFEGITFPLYDDAEPRVVIASGPSPRGPFAHVVMVEAAGGEVLHDPHPSRAGLVSVDGVLALVPPYDPPPAPMAELAR